MEIKGILRFFAVRAFEGIVAILLVTFMPNLPPNAKFSQSYSVTPPLELEGKLALNGRLNNAEIWHKGDFMGPEAFAEYNGELYTTLHGGDVVKLTAGNHITPVVKFGRPCKGVYQEQICGRPLGLTFDKNGALYVADAYYGIFKVDVKTGKQLQLVSVDHEIDGKKPKIPNSVDVASNGDLYWSDSSTEFALSDGIFDMIADGSGRLIHYDAKTKKNTVLIDGLHFANGVILSSDESFVLVSETGRSRIHRYYLKGPKKGSKDIFLDGIPGLPDNLQTDGQGGFLVPLVMARDSKHPSGFQIFGPFPLVRKFVSRLLGLTQLGFKIVDQVYPNEWAERGIHFVGHFSSLSGLLTPARVTVLHVSKDGEILDSLHTLDKKISGISEAFIFKDYLYLGSPFNDYIGRVPLSKAGLKHLAASQQQTRTPPATQAPPKPSTTTQPPTPSSTQAPKVTTPPPTQAPKVTTPPSTQAPKVTTPPPTQAPKVTTPPPTQAPKVTTPPPTQAPKVTTPPTQPPRQPPPTAAPKQAPTAAPKQAPTTTSPPKQAPTTTSPPVKQSPPPQKPTTPKQAQPKESHKDTSKQTPPPSQEQVKEQPKTVPGKDAPKNAK